METSVLAKSRCKSCGKGFVDKEVNVKGVKIIVTVPQCECLLEEHLAKEKEYHINKLIRMSGIAKMYWNDDLKSWQSTQADSHFKEINILVLINKYLYNLDKNVLHGKGIIISGKVGTGKTRLSSYLGIQIIKRKQLKIHFVTTSEIYSKFRENDLRMEAIDNCLYCDVLILDDLGESPIEEWNKKYLFLIVNKRYENLKPILINTMQPLTFLYDERYIGKHIMSRLIHRSRGYIAEIKSDKDMRYQI